MTASAARRDVDDLRCMLDRGGDALLRGRQSSPLPTLRPEDRGSGAASTTTRVRVWA